MGKSVIRLELCRVVSESACIRARFDEHFLISSNSKAFVKKPVADNALHKQRQPVDLRGLFCA